MHLSDINSSFCLTHSKFINALKYIFYQYLLIYTFYIRNINLCIIKLIINLLTLFLFRKHVFFLMLQAYINLYIRF